MLTKDNSASTNNINRNKMKSIEKKLQAKVKNENNYPTGSVNGSSINVTNENLTTYSDIVTKGINCKNSRTFSLDLSNSLHFKKTLDDNILNKSNNLANVDPGIKASQGTSGNKNNNTGNNSNSGSVKASFAGNNNLNSVMKEFSIKNSKKNMRTNSIVLYNNTEYNTNANISSGNSNLLGSSLNTGVKKLLTKTNSGNATTFSKYLASVGLSKGKEGASMNKTNVNMNKSGTNLNSAVNVTMYATTTNVTNSNAGKSSTSKKKDTNDKSKVSFPGKFSVSSYATNSNKSKSKGKAIPVSYTNYTNQNTISSVLNTHSNNNHGNNEPKSTNSLNISRDYNGTQSNNTRTRNSKTPNEEEDDYFIFNNKSNMNLNSDNSPPLTNDTKMKLSEIKHSIIELLNNSRSNKTLILKELESIYKYVLNSNSPVCDEESSKGSRGSKGSKDLTHGNFHLNVRKSILSSGTNTAWASVSNSVNFNAKSSKRNPSEKELQLIDLENELLKKENDNLKTKIEVIDKKFDRIVNENSELRQYVKEKSDNIEELRTVLYSFKNELMEVKKKTENNTGGRNTQMGNGEEDDDDNNISIDQIGEVSGKEKKCPFNINLNLESKLSGGKITIPLIHIKKSDELTEGDFNDRLSDKERTACFADILSKDDRLFNKDEEIKIYNDYDDSLNLNKGGNENESNFINESEQSIDLDILNRQSKTAQMSQIQPSQPTQTLKGLNFANLPKHSDFNEEFLENYDDFSPSWRKEVEQIKLSKINYIKFRKKVNR